MRHIAANFAKYIHNSKDINLFGCNEPIAFPVKPSGEALHYITFFLHGVISITYSGDSCRAWDLSVVCFMCACVCTFASIHCLYVCFKVPCFIIFCNKCHNFALKKSILSLFSASHGRTEYNNLLVHACLFPHTEKFFTQLWKSMWTQLTVMYKITQKTCHQATMQESDRTRV